ncbi:hypothetical protein KGQ19_02895 [Catenulispora sp. NL8]|uniref:PknH-like extracellular domain-containing protein n=1 Tax=Catenulispora pinistramenti TaxID=2705254 RepID=A0ABS5KJV0_9ACTN|nr:hypothetical protein [Catenulispora pinistramenti]MBS2545809.1 hypothetical protein [Catenulispora pinistramenti]
MSRIMPLVALTVSALLVGCSSASDKGKSQASETSTTVTTTAATATPTSAATSQPSASATSPLAGLALAISDLPYGWASSPPSTDSSVTAPCSAITADATAHLPNQAEVDFQQSEDGPFLQEILAGGSAQQTQAAWAAVQKAPSLCVEPTRLATTPFQSYGDASYALALTATRAGVAYGGDVVVIRKGQTFAEVVVFGVGGVQPALVQQVAAKAVGKLGS